MKENVRERIIETGFSAAEVMVREVVLWNRKTHMEHTSEEIKDFVSQSNPADSR